jgi:hypothetical protein
MINSTAHEISNILISNLITAVSLGSIALLITAVSSSCYTLQQFCTAQVILTQCIAAIPPLQQQQLLLRRQTSHMCLLLQ